MTRTPAAIDADARAIAELAKSRGWELIREHLKEEVYRLSVAKSRNTKLSAREADMTDGAISATDGFLKIASTMALRLEGEKALLAPTSPLEGATPNAE